MSAVSGHPSPSPNGIITLTTDFGRDSAYVAAMKGVVLTINPRAVLVDLAHGIRPQDIRQAAWVLSDTCHWFPDGTIHVVVVDPGVGSDRRLIYALIGSQHFVAVDNGLLGRLALARRPSRIIGIQEPRYWLSAVSATFHGRDVLAPVAARLSLGLDPACLGPPLDSMLQLDWREVAIVPGKIEGSVRSVDSFGNLVTDITEPMLAGVPRDGEVRIVCDEHETLGIFRTYSDQPETTFMALIGSEGYLELAIVGDSAAKMLGVGTGAAVQVTW